MEKIQLNQNDMLLMSDYIKIEEGTIKLKDIATDESLNIDITNIKLKMILIPSLEEPEKKLMKINTIITTSNGDIISSLSETIARYFSAMTSCMGIPSNIGYFSSDIRANITITKKYKNNKNYYAVVLNNIADQEIEYSSIPLEKINNLLIMNNRKELDI